MIGWHHRLNGHEFEQVLEVGEEQGSLACCSPWSHKESDMTEWLNWAEISNLLSLFKIDFPPLRVNLSEHRKGHHQCWGQGEARGVGPFSSCLQSFPASGSFQMSQFFASGDQSIGVSASASVLPVNTQDWSPLGWKGLISLQSKGLLRIPYFVLDSHK